MAAGPDGRWVASDGDTVHAWAGDDLVRSVERATALGGPPRVLADGTARAGRYAIDLDSGDVTEMLSLEALLEIYGAEGDPNQFVVRSVAWTSDGAHTLAFAEYLPTRLRGGSDAVRPGALLVFADVGSGQLTELDRGRFLVAAPLAGDRLLVSGGARLRAFEGNPASAALDLTLDSPATAVATVGDLVVAGLAGGEVVAVSVTDTGAVRRWVGHEDVVDAVALSPDGSLVASGDRAGVVLVRRCASDADTDPMLRVEVGGTVDGACFLAADHLVVAVDGAERELRHLHLELGR